MEWPLNELFHDVERSESTFLRWRMTMMMTIKRLGKNQVIIAQWLAQRLATVEVLGSNPEKGENLLISD